MSNHVSANNSGSGSNAVGLAIQRDVAVSHVASQQPFTEHIAQATPPTETFFFKTIHDPVAAFTGVLACATIGLWIFTWKLWRATYNLACDAATTGADQASKMERSIEQAARSAMAMEGVAAAMAMNSASIAESVEISRRISKQQDTYSKAQTRAYISVLIGGAIFQDKNHIFEAQPVIVNSGNTPARDIQYRIAADVLPVPLPDEFKFPLSKLSRGSNILGPQRDGSLGATVPRRIPDDEVAAVKAGLGKSLYVWGVASYRDIYGTRHRCTFAQQLYWQPSGPASETGEVPEIIRGYHLHKHNRAN